MSSPEFSDVRKKLPTINKKPSTKEIFSRSINDTKSLFSDMASDLDDPGSNPFKLPANYNFFLLQTVEKERKKMEQRQEKKLKVLENCTRSSRMNSKQGEQRQKLRIGMETTRENTAVELRDNPAWKVAMIKDRNIEKESINEFISKKREMFLLEYSLMVKHGEMEQLEKVATAEEKKLQQAEKFLQEDSLMFDRFLKENDKNSAEAIKIAEQETKVKLEKVSEIKKIMANIIAIKSDISKHEEILAEYTMYKEFLLKLSPIEWQEKQQALSEKMEKAKPANMDKDREKRLQADKRTDRKSSSGGRELPSLRETKAPSRHSLRSTSQSGKLSVESRAEDTSLSDYEEEPELYFTKPQELLDLLTELEEQNLSLIQNSRDTEEALEEFRQIMDVTRKKMEQEMDQLTQQIDTLTQTMEKEKERASELEIKARLFSFHTNKAEDQDGMLERLGLKVKEVYRTCVGDSEANLSTLQMLAAIEDQLGELLEKVEMIPPDHLQMIEKAKDKERRLRLREEKMNLQKQHKEARLRKALERAQAEVKKTSGKKLMFRSQPPVHKTKASGSNDVNDQEKEEHLYFFT